MKLTSSGTITVFSSTNLPQGPRYPSISPGSSLRNLFLLSSGLFFVDSKTVFPDIKTKENKVKSVQAEF